MRIRLVSYDEDNNWILAKFAHRMHDSLVRLGRDAQIVREPDPTADINHHICYAGFDGTPRGHDTLMITHIDDSAKLALINKQMETASVGVCMSHETVRYLAAMGVPRSKLCFVNPAHDGVMPLRKIVVGIACRVQEDGRKREDLLVRVARQLDPQYFTFRIMGDSWEPQVSALRSLGFSVDYFDHFEYNEYLRFIPGLDYYLYMGMDEGQMGFIDALAAGVDTIVTAQGYHLDAPGGIVHPFKTDEELERIFRELQDKKRALTSAVATWTWDDYARKHIEIWEHLVDGHAKTSRFLDGVNTLGGDTAPNPYDSPGFVSAKKRELRLARVSHYVYSQKRWLRDSYRDGGPWRVISVLSESGVGFIRRVMRRLTR